MALSFYLKAYYMNHIFAYNHLAKKAKINCIAQKYQKNQLFFDGVKIGGMVIRFMINLIIYLVNVNDASTRWFFYREVQKDLEQIEFQYNITNLDVVEYRRTMRKSLQNARSVQAVDVANEIVMISVDQDLAMR